MEDDDIKRKNERQGILEKKLNEAFPDARVLPGKLGVEVEVKTLQKAKVILQPDDSLMMDEDSSFERIFKSGIEYAKRILSNPPIKGQVPQGKLHLLNDGVKYSEPE